MALAEARLVGAGAVVAMRCLAVHEGAGTGLGTVTVEEVAVAALVVVVEQGAL